MENNKIIIIFWSTINKNRTKCIINTDINKEFFKQIWTMWGGFYICSWQFKNDKKTIKKLFKKYSDLFPPTKNSLLNLKCKILFNNEDITKEVLEYSAYFRGWDYNEVLNIKKINDEIFKENQKFYNIKDNLIKENFDNKIKSLEDIPNYIIKNDFNDFNNFTKNNFRKILEKVGQLSAIEEYNNKTWFVVVVESQTRKNKLRFIFFENLDSSHIQDYNFDKSLETAILQNTLLNDVPFLNDEKTLDSLIVLPQFSGHNYVVFVDDRLEIDWVQKDINKSVEAFIKKQINKNSDKLIENITKYQNKIKNSKEFKIKEVDRLEKDLKLDSIIRIRSYWFSNVETYKNRFDIIANIKDLLL